MNKVERRLAILCAIAGVVLLIIAASLVAIQGRVTQGAGYSLIAGVALLIGYAILDPTAITDLFRSRQARFGSLSVIVTAVVLGILVMVNVIASRGDQAADLTKSGLYTLAPQSALVARKLDSDLVVTGFFRPDETSSQQSVADLLALYRQQSPHVKVTYEDPDKNPVKATRLGVTIPGSVVLEYKSKTPIVLTLASETESDFTAAMLKLESNRTPIICWASGEGERDLKELNQVFGYSAAAAEMQNQNFKVQDLLLSQQAAVPPECDVVAIVAIQKPLSAAAARSLSAYLDGGGKLLVAADPWIVDPAAVPSLNAVLQPYGVTFDGGLVVEPDAAHAASNDPTTPVVFDYGNSPITKDLAKQFSFFPQSTALVGTATGGITGVQVAQTTPIAFDIVNPRDSLTRQAADKEGPFTMMATLEKPPLVGSSNVKAMRIVLVGTSAIAENRALPPSANGQNDRLLLGSLDWLTQQEDLIAVAAKPSAASPLSLTEEQLRFNEVFTLGLLPALVILVGVGVWMSRRRSFTG